MSPCDDANAKCWQMMSLTKRRNLETGRSMIKPVGKAHLIDSIR